MKKRFSGEHSSDLAQVVEDCVVIYSNDESVIFDKTPAQVCRYLPHLHCMTVSFVLQILKRDILMPETFGGDLIDYPPRLYITARTNTELTLPEIYVNGLDRECGFNLFISKGRIKGSLCG